MKSKLSILLLLNLLAFLMAHAQQKAPLIKGTADISIKKGTFNCDFTITDMPDIKNYMIRLNSGMNVRYFRDLSRDKTKSLNFDMDTKDSIGSDETKAYLVHENHNPGRYLPSILQIKYLGMYNVVTDSASGYMGVDWRGNIAFNGYSVRAEGLQGDWYPVLYDKDTRRKYEEVRYDIQVTCGDCSVLFVNGSTAVKGKSARFASETPRELSMYCGNFKTTERNGVWLLNSDMQPEDEQKFFNTIDSYQKYYQNKFNIPLKGNLTFIHTSPVSDPKEGYAFSFFSAPSTFNVGIGEYGLKNMFNGSNRNKNKQSMAHELAHYYFGTLVKPGDEFGYALEEGMSEYLSYKLTLDIEGAETYHQLLKNKIAALQYLIHYKPFSLVKTTSDYGNAEDYKYKYTAVLLLAIEKEIGDQNMWNWIKAMVATRTTHSDYQFLVSTLDKTLDNDVLKQKVIDKYFTSDKALQNAKDKLGEK